MTVIILSRFAQWHYVGSLTLTRGCVLCRPCCVLVVRGAISRAVAQAVSRRPVTTEAPVRSHVSPCDICYGQSGTETGFSPSSSVLPCQYHSTNATYSSSATCCS